VSLWRCRILREGTEELFSSLDRKTHTVVKEVIWFGCSGLRVCLGICRVNVDVGAHEDRMLITGLHTVADIRCTGCNTVIGWKYVRASAHCSSKQPKRDTRKFFLYHCNCKKPQESEHSNIGLLWVLDR
jgi:Yippee zinc-binding/DNA-binding /Mis18, centromere assembly